MRCCYLELGHICELIDLSTYCYLNAIDFRSLSSSPALLH